MNSLIVIPDIFRIQRYVNILKLTGLYNWTGGGGTLVFICRGHRGSQWNTSDAWWNTKDGPGLCFVLLTDLDLCFDPHPHSITWFCFDQYNSGGMHQKMWPNSDCIPSEYLRVYTCPEHHWLALYKLASIKLKGTIPVKIVLIITSIYPCIRACFNWFFLFELKNIIELIWITGCFASVHQHSPNNTCRYQGNMITVFVCFSTINYFNAFILIFTQKQTTLCISQQHNN